MYKCRHTHTGVPTRKHEYTYGRIQNNLHKQYVINSVIVLKHIIFGITNFIKDFRNSKFKMFHLVSKKFIMDQIAPESRCKLQTYPLGVFTEVLLVHICVWLLVTASTVLFPSSPIPGQPTQWSLEPRVWRGKGCKKTSQWGCWNSKR